VGPLDMFTHIWEYRGYPGYDMTVARQETQGYYQAYRKEVGSYLISRRSDLMQEFAFWNTVPPRALGGIFELRTYGLKPGKLLEWEGHWRKGLEVRKNFMEPIGAWFTQIGTLNRVYHIWQFPGTPMLNGLCANLDLQYRKESRERCWSMFRFSHSILIVDLEGWADTVHHVLFLVGRLIVDHAVGRIDGSTYPKSVGFQSHPLVKKTVVQ